MNETHFFWGHCRVSTGCHCSSAVKVEFHFSSMGFSLQRTARKSHRGEISWIVNFMYQPIAVLCCAYNCASRIDLIDMRGHLDSSSKRSGKKQWRHCYWSNILMHMFIIHMCLYLSACSNHKYFCSLNNFGNCYCHATAQGWQRSMCCIPFITLKKYFMLEIGGWVVIAYHS